MRRLVLSGQGRLHVAAPLGDAWRGVCGSIITRPQAFAPTDWAQLLDGSRPACFYCAVVAEAIVHEQMKARQAVEDAVDDMIERPWARGRAAS